MRSVAFVFAGLQLATAHICMWSPPQREGAFQISTPGEPLCYLKEGPCGGINSEEPTTTLQGGKEFSVLFQQNLNHFYTMEPGQLIVDFALNGDPAEEDFQQLGIISDYNAMNEITQTNFTLKVQIPDIDSEHSVMRVRYMSNNPTENDRGMIFYQCSDVKVEKSSDSSRSTDAPSVAGLRGSGSGSATTAAEAGVLDCCAPAQFTVQGYETSSWRNPTQKIIYFDSVNQLIRIDTNSGSGTTTLDGHFQMYNNFTSGIEYYYNVNEGSCDLYGLNLWSDWCYGAVNNQAHVSDIQVGHEKCDVWGPASAEGGVFTWTSSRLGCVPVGQNRADTGETTIYYNFAKGAPDSSVFALPDACTEAHSAHERLLRGVTQVVGASALPPRPAHHFSVN